QQVSESGPVGDHCVRGAGPFRSSRIHGCCTVHRINDQIFVPFQAAAYGESPSTLQSDFRVTNRPIKPERHRCISRPVIYSVPCQRPTSTSHPDRHPNRGTQPTRCTSSNPKRRRLQIRRIMQRIQLLESDLRIPTTLLSQHPRNRWQILAWPPINPIPTLIVTGPVLQHCLALGPVCPGFPTGFYLTKPIEHTRRVTLPVCTQLEQPLCTTQIVRTRHHTITTNTRRIIIINRSLARLVTGYIHVIIM